MCFIILLFLLIGAVSASNSDNETLQKTVDQPNDNISQPNCEDTLTLSQNTEKLERNVNPDNAIKSKLVHSIVPATASAKTKVTLKAPDVKMYYKDGSKFIVTLKNPSKKPIAKATIKITIDGKTYAKTTNSNGKVSMDLNFKSGKYTVTTTFDGTKTYEKKSVKSTVTIKSTIKCSDMTKFYKNKAAYYSTFYDKKGKVLKEAKVKFTLNSKTHTVKTSKKGVGKLAVDLKPGRYSITLINSKTSESVAKTITVKSLIETHDLTMNENDKSKFTVKVFNNKGKVSSGKRVTVKVNGKTYTPTSDSKGIASQVIDLPAGRYTITTEYDGLKNTNYITVNSAIKHNSFSHITSIPTYVNVTIPYVFHNSAYSVKSGVNGIVKMPKNEAFTIKVNSNQSHLFTRTQIPGVDSTVIGYKTYLIPFDGSAIRSDFNRENLKGDGILIWANSSYTQIEYRSTTEENTELFGVYMDRGLENSETITYLQNYNIKAMINLYTGGFDETGLKYNLGKYYDKTIYDFYYKTYDEITNGKTEYIKFANTGNPVTFDLFGKSIVGYNSKEDIITRFIVNGKEELEKQETISYGLGEKYRMTLGFEVLQSYAIINKKVTREILERWVELNPGYLIRQGVSNVYGMFLASLETAWLADEIADQYANDLNVKWSRESTTTILGGINLDDTYLHILNADMGMNVTGDEDSAKVFRLMNSFYLPNVENYVLTPVAERYSDNTTSSVDSILESVNNNKFSIAKIGEMFYILSEDDNTTIVINSTSGIANGLLVEKDFAYKGATIKTTNDCCSVGTVTSALIKNVKDDMNKLKNVGGNVINGLLNKAHPLISLFYTFGSLSASVISKIAPSATTGLASTIGLILQVHTVGKIIKNDFMDESSWHWAYKHVTFTRDSPLENKKFFNIPKSDGTYDYIEVEINSDGSLNRNNALYVGDGYTKKLTKSETYKYFTEEKWTSCNIPRKYLKNEVPLIFG